MRYLKDARSDGGPESFPLPRALALSPRRSSIPLRLTSPIARAVFYPPRASHRRSRDLAVASNIASCLRRSWSGDPMPPDTATSMNTHCRPDAPPQDPQVCQSLPAVQNRALNPNLN